MTVSWSPYTNYVIYQVECRFEPTALFYNNCFRLEYNKNLPIHALPIEGQTDRGEHLQSICDTKNKALKKLDTWKLIL